MLCLLCKATCCSRPDFRPALNLLELRHPAFKTFSLEANRNQIVGTKPLEVCLGVRTVQYQGSRCFSLTRSQSLRGWNPIHVSENCQDLYEKHTWISDTSSDLIVKEDALDGTFSGIWRGLGVGGVTRVQCPQSLQQCSFRASDKVLYMNIEVGVSCG